MTNRGSWGPLLGSQINPQHTIGTRDASNKAIQSGSKGPGPGKAMTLCGGSHEIKMLGNKERLAVSDRNALKEMLTVAESTVA